VPTEIHHQGRLFEAGVPLDGTHDLKTILWDASASGVNQWEETNSVEFDNGYFAITLGQTVPVTSAIVGDGGLWLELTVDAGAAIPDRIEMTSVPYALNANQADSLAAGATVDFTSVTVNGSTVIGTDGKIAWTSITGGPTDTLGLLTCGSGDTLQFVGSAWACSIGSDGGGVVLPNVADPVSPQDAATKA